MWKLFGGKKKTKEEAQPKKDPMETVKHLDERINDIEKRTKVLENKNKGVVGEALAKKKAGDKRGAVLALKKKKMYDQEINKLGGMRILMEQQKMAIESSMTNQDIFSALSEGATQIESLQNQAGIEKFEDLKDKIEEQMQSKQEIDEFLGGIALEDEDELLDELEELEALEAEKDMDLENAGVGAIDIGEGPAPVPAGKIGGKTQEQLEEEKLEAMMAL